MSQEIQGPLTAEDVIDLPEVEIGVSGHRCRDCGCNPKVGRGKGRQWYVQHYTLYCEECKK